MQRKLSHIMKPEYKSMTYIEVPKEEWYHGAETDEIYKFDKGLFYAHSRLPGLELKYNTTSIQKKPPSDSRVIEVDEDAEAITCIIENPTNVPTWMKVTEPAEIERWLMQRNKKHLQQVHNDQSLCTQDLFKISLAHAEQVCTLSNYLNEGT